MGTSNRHAVRHTRRNSGESYFVNLIMQGEDMACNVPSTTKDARRIVDAARL